VISNLKEQTHIVVFNALGQQVFIQPVITEKTALKTSLAKGIYYYQLKEGENITGSGKLVIE